MFSKIVAGMVNISSASTKEVEIFLVQILFILIAIPFRKMPNTKIKTKTPLFPNLGLKKLLAALVGFVVIVSLLTYIELLILNLILVVHYLMVKYIAKCPRSKFVVSFLAFSLHFYVSIESMINNYGENYPSHFDLITMLMVLKMMYYVWDWDFRIEHGLSQKKNEEDKNDSNSKERKEKRAFVEKSEKSFVEMMCYCYCFPGILVGPTLSFREYKFFIEDDPKNFLKTSKKEVLSELGILGFSILCVVFQNDIIDFQKIRSPDLGQKSFLYRLFWAYGYFFFYRIKLVVAFSISHLSNMILGLRGIRDGAFDGLCRCFNFFKVEFSIVFRERISNWNIAIAKWLRFCYYDPMLRDFKINKGNASLVVFFISGIWHGFYPSYTIGLLIFHSLNMTERYLFKLRDLVPDFIQKILRLFLNICLGSAGVIFAQLEWGATKIALKNLSPILISMLVSQ